MAPETYRIVQYSESGGKKGCGKKHQNYAGCQRRVVCRNPLSCSKFYIGKTERSISDRLHGHSSGINPLKHFVHNCAQCTFSALSVSRQQITQLFFFRQIPNSVVLLSHLENAAHTSHSKYIVHPPYLDRQILSPVT